MRVLPLFCWPEFWKPPCQSHHRSAGSSVCSLKIQEQHLINAQKTWQNGEHVSSCVVSVCVHMHGWVDSAVFVATIDSYDNVYVFVCARHFAWGCQHGSSDTRVLCVRLNPQTQLPSLLILKNFKSLDSGATMSCSSLILQPVTAVEFTTQLKTGRRTFFKSTHFTFESCWIFNHFSKVSRSSSRTGCNIIFAA